MVSTADPLSIDASDLWIRRVGEPTRRSPMVRLLHGRASSPHYVHESDRVLLDDTVGSAVAHQCAVGDLPSLEPGGPREYIYFDPPRTRAAIVTCGGLCPGLNNVIRGLVLELADNYGVTEVLGFRNGFRGLVDGSEPMPLTPGRGRGHPQPRRHHPRHLARRPGPRRDGRDAGPPRRQHAVRHRRRRHAARGAADRRRGGPAGRQLSVVGVPKTIDNDIPYIDHSFGFQTAFGRAAESIKSAQTEASSTPNGVGLVKLMGRHSGFIACYAALASHDVDFVLIPEVPFELDGPTGFLASLRRRVDTAGARGRRGGRGRGPGAVRLRRRGDASGNAKLADIGRLLREAILADFAAAGTELSLRYVDPGYAIRSVAANA